MKLYLVHETLFCLNKSSTRDPLKEVFVNKLCDYILEMMTFLGHSPLNCVSSEYI